ncbi:alpha/beta hydrolase [Burkholderia sp. Ax-1719]|uniref:alpha/beta hydrolase family protein n=1 Tax=Burkholderia sp. Ax-1719 TaxID=2608334 RepID=UPI00141DFD70|nr:alpha/beta hydrolase [Burkholderia sp. Ax-1719]NIE62629.1 prolyl oligopeptidase family serine peptidase [Burkholderia sp. Ax-1719]
MNDALTSATLAYQRAMPMTRLLDCGMEFADAQALFQRTSAGEQWDQVAETLAQAQLDRAAQAADAGCRVTATEAQAAALADLLFAQMAFNHDNARKRALYDQLVGATRRLCDWSEGRMTRVEVPFEQSQLVGWLMRPRSQRAAGTVLVFGGQSGWGVAYLPIARALARRGLATLLAEGPGQGETRMHQGVHVDVNLEAAYSQFISFILNDASLGQPGIWGNSVGGLWAARTAAADARIRACCVNGGLAKPTLLPFRTFAEQAAAMLGTDNEDAIRRNFERMSFRPERDRIACPVLVLHGGADPLVKLEDQRPFLDAADSADTTLRIWEDGEHTIYNHAAERTAFVADWFASRLGGGRA